MTDIVTRDDLLHLARTAGEPSVSIYLPTHRAGSETTQDPIRLKNLVAQARTHLVAIGLRAPQADELLAPATRLPHDHGFWDSLEDGLAVLLTSTETRAYRLPDPVDELVVVADHLHLKPLLPFVADEVVFYVLALSQNQVRLLRGGRYRVREVALAGVPRSLDEALKFDDRESQLHSHGASRVGLGRVSAAYHGQGVGRDTQQVDLERFVSLVDKGVRLAIDGDAPLVLAGVEPTVAVYRDVSHHTNLVDNAVIGSVEQLSAVVLHARAWSLVEDLFDRERRAMAQAVLEDSVPSVHTVAEAVAAARSGRIAAVFVPLDGERWGTVDADTGEVHEHEDRRPGDRDLYDLVAVETLVHGGRAFTGDVPGPGPVAAALRY